MDGMLGEFAGVVGGLSFSEPTIPIVSNLTGGLASAGELRSPDYWVRHARETVRFADGVRLLLEQGVTSFLELGPGGVLSAMVADCVDGRGEFDDPTAEEVREGGVGDLRNREGHVTAVPVLRAGYGEGRAFLGAWRDCGLGA